ncbi:MAG: Gfo/Idh/MocA family oxidoreductase [Acidobacteria bacterium]|nr:Gfo/Idh/MocA family oxidoreductase [Acidobacteriota bacterium]
MDISRRKFVGLSAMGAARVAAAHSGAAKAAPFHSMAGVRFERKDPRVAFIGVGNRGTALLKNMLGAEAKIVAICDIVPEYAKKAQAMVEKTGQPTPELYTDGDHAYEKLVKRGDVDLVIVATPWSWHARMAVAAMEHGKHVCVEVPAVRTLEECWQIVHVSEKTRRHCMMLENCCYGYNETLVLRMAQDGRFGDLLWGEGAYLHDLREELFGNAHEGLWRRTENTLRNGNLYPTHGLGPVANYMGILRGDNFSHIVSMSSPARGLAAYRAEHVPAGDPKWKERYVEGDMNTSLIKTVKGLTITVKHDVSNPTPYSRINALGGVKGQFMDYPPRIYFDGQPGGEKWADLSGFKQYEHPLWTKMGQIAKKLGGHGGMDFIMLYRLLENFRNGLAPDMDVYDAALWSSVGPLSIASVAHGSAPQQFPDFLRGGWKNREISAVGK